MGITAYLIFWLLVIVGTYSVITGAILAPFRYYQTPALAWRVTIKEFVRYMLTFITAIIGCVLFPGEVDAAAARYIADPGYEHELAGYSSYLIEELLKGLPAFAILYAIVVAGSYAARGLKKLILGGSKH